MPQAGLTQRGERDFLDQTNDGALVKDRARMPPVSVDQAPDGQSLSLDCMTSSLKKLPCRPTAVPVELHTMLAHGAGAALFVAVGARSLADEQWCGRPSPA